MTKELYIFNASPITPQVPKEKKKSSYLLLLFLICYPPNVQFNNNGITVKFVSLDFEHYVILYNCNKKNYLFFETNIFFI